MWRVRGLRDRSLVREVVFAIPGDLATPTGGYRYDRRVMEELGKLGWNVRVLALPGDFPSPSGVSLRKTEEMLATTSEEAPVFFDGLAFGAIPSEILVRVPRRYVALVHHPLAFETGLAPERISYFRHSERAALVHAVSVVVTSAATRHLLVADFGVTIDCVTVAEPGTEPASRARGSGGSPRFLSVGAVSPRKGFRTLVEALSAIAELDWDCRIAGSLDRDPDETAALRKRIAEAKLDKRVALLGTLDEDRLQAEYDRATLFVLPSHFEGYGMAFAEALAHGLPIVACSGSATGSTVPAAAGIFVPAGNAEQLAAALRHLISNPAEIGKRSDAAWEHAKSLPRWRDTAAKIAAVLEAAAA
jgi:glycosyltransferase involved in cell wall biosynthesis